MREPAAGLEFENQEIQDDHDQDQKQHEMKLEMLQRRDFRWIYRVIRMN